MLSNRATGWKRTGRGALLALSMAALVAGCSGESKKQEDVKPAAAARAAAKPQRSKDPVKGFLGFIDAYNGQNLASVLGSLSPDIEWIPQTAFRKTLKGRAAVARHLLAEHSVFPDSKQSVVRVLVAGNQLAVQVVFQGTHRGPVLGIAPTRKKIDYGVVYFTAMKDGMLARNIAYFDVAAPLRSMSAASGKEGAIPSLSAEPEIVRAPGKEPNENTVKRFFAILAEGDMSKLAEVLVEKPTVDSHTGDAPLVDLEAIKKLFAERREPFEKMDIASRTFISSGEYVAAEIELRGKYKLRRSGADNVDIKDVNLPAAYFFKLSGDKIAEIDIYRDEFDVPKAFGMKPREALALVGIVQAGAAAVGAPPAESTAKGQAEKKAPQEKASASVPKKKSK